MVSLELTPEELRAGLAEVPTSLIGDVRTPEGWEAYFTRHPGEFHARREDGGFTVRMDRLEVAAHDERLPQALIALYHRLHPMPPADGGDYEHWPWERTGMHLVFDTACVALSRLDHPIAKTRTGTEWGAYFLRSDYEAMGFRLDYYDGTWCASYDEPRVAYQDELPEGALLALARGMMGNCYADGTPARVGDHVLASLPDGTKRSGIVTYVESIHNPDHLTIACASRFTFHPVARKGILDAKPEDYVSESASLTQPILKLDDDRAIVTSNAIFVAQQGVPPFMVVTDSIDVPAVGCVFLPGGFANRVPEVASSPMRERRLRTIEVEPPHAPTPG